ncbi:alpha/beta fold hydrolase [Phenylobacterium sp. J367]|uniref:alpha/beta fold hydrolase n=1 Tax=Phenylobacterium sp. J367 TaxID=2898435 RepID=UPI002150B70D|nr:alpha/beta hydrolase [Phenylobacterium sp. J367]MCR5878863.1 alpha/beta hydrolase [Phenylobacterium sp. J367]
MLLAIYQRVAALASLAVLALGGTLIWSWFEVREILGDDVDAQDWRLWTGGALLAVALLGRLPTALLLGEAGDDWGRLRRDPGHLVETPDGARLYVERSGPADAPVLIFVHGWGLDSGVWWEARRALADRYQVVTYDLPGLGRSKPYRDRRYSIERMAEDLTPLIAEACPRKVILVGHSIGGMIVQTFCRRHPEMLGRQVLGVVLENTTHTDPMKTTILGRGLVVFEPLVRLVMRLDIFLQPLVWLMNWQSYLSGSTHLAMRLGGFGTTPTRAQLEQVSRAVTRNSPAVQARGNLAMMDWSVTEDLASLRVPALVFIGGSDIVTVPEAGETIARRMPDATPDHVTDAGHLGPLELAHAYNSAIERFADTVFTRGARPADAAPRPYDGAPAEAERRPFQDPHGPILAP